MTINRRRAPSSLISSDKKLSGHKREVEYALLINGQVILGTQKGDVRDSSGQLHSVKSGKKWQVFLYSYSRISSSRYLNILKSCLDAFPADYTKYLPDREKCIAYKEEYFKNFGADLTKKLTNKEILDYTGPNTYMSAKDMLGEATAAVCDLLKDKEFLRYFLDEALFNNEEVEYLAIKDDTYLADGKFKIFSSKDVLDILSSKLTSNISEAGKVLVDYNVAGQKTLLQYVKNNRLKNIVEIEIRNDSNTHYRQVRFNMYSKDTLSLLASSLPSKGINEDLVVYGSAIDTFKV